MLILSEFQEVFDRLVPMNIPVYTPDLSGNEKKYVLDALESGWISSIGAYVDKFEKSLAEETGFRNVIAVCNGTVALHLAIHCLDIGPGDEVIVPTFTYIASVNTIAQTGAKPVFVDVQASDWLMDPEQIERKITSKTKAIMPVHLYSGLCDDRVNELARQHGLSIIEDCAEALGSNRSGRHAGIGADVATFSFFGNKTVTTGEGGAVASNNDALAARMRKVKGQGQSLTRRYWHDELGFNYRMTNIAAAVGVAQMERFSQIVERKQHIASLYRSHLNGFPFDFQKPSGDVTSNEWLVSLLLPDGSDRDLIMAEMAANGVDTRPVFYCAHHMPMYFSEERFPIAENIASRGISLPSYPGLTDDDIERVCDVLKSASKVGNA